MNPEPFLQLDRVIHEKGRLAIVSMLVAHPDLSFTEMRDLLKMTDGNLTAHIRTLKQAEYLAVTKSVRGKRSLTTYNLTQKGRNSFTQYLKLLEEIIQRHLIGGEVVKEHEITTAALGGDA